MAIGCCGRSGTRTKGLCPLGTFYGPLNVAFYRKKEASVVECGVFTLCETNMRKHTAHRPYSAHACRFKAFWPGWNRVSHIVTKKGQCLGLYLASLSSLALY